MSDPLVTHQWQSLPARQIPGNPVLSLNQLGMATLRAYCQAPVFRLRATACQGCCRCFSSLGSWGTPGVISLGIDIAVFEAGRNLC